MAPKWNLQLGTPPVVGETSSAGGSAIAIRARRSPSDANPAAVHIQLNDESDEEGDGKHIKLRWSTARVARYVKTLCPIQKKHITKHGFGFVFDIKSFRVPVGFIEWVMSNTSSSSCEFILNQKCICFTKDMVTKVLGVPSGNKLVKVNTTDFEVEALVDKYKAEYKEGHSYPIKMCMKLMSKMMNRSLRGTLCYF